MNNTKQLNPFSFPPETSLRFVILFSLMIFLAWELNYYTINLGFFEEEWSKSSQEIDQLNEINYDPPVYHVGNLVTKELLADTDYHLNLSNKYIKTGINWFGYSLPFPLLVILLSILYYLIYPKIITHQLRLRNLSTDKDVDLAEAFDNLVNFTKINPKPILKISEAYSDAQAFGTFNNNYIAVGKQFPSLYKNNFSYFKTIILHELAHVFNGDISRAYISLALWSVWNILIVIPYIIFAAYRILVLLGYSIFEALLPNTIKLIAFSIILKIIANSIVRIREFYADWRVVCWGASEEIEGVISNNVDASKSKFSIFQILRKYHPSLAERLETIKKPDKLFQISNGLGVVTGFTLGYALSLGVGFEAITDSIRDGLVLFSANSLLSFHFADRIGTILGISDVLFVIFCNIVARVLQEVIVAFPPLFFSLLVAGTIGIQAQRQFAYEINNKTNLLSRLINEIRTSIFFAVGVELGFFLIALGPLYPKNNLVLSVIVVTISLFGFALISFIWLGFTRYLFRLMINSHHGKKLPMLKQIYVTINSGLFFFFLVQPLFNMRASISLYYILDMRLEFQHFITITTYCIFGLLLQNILILTVWIFMMLVRRIRIPKCHNCNTVISLLGIGNNCSTCGQPVAEWMYIDKSGSI